MRDCIYLYLLSPILARIPAPRGAPENGAAMRIKGKVGNLGQRTSVFRRFHPPIFFFHSKVFRGHPGIAGGTATPPTLTKPAKEGLGGGARTPSRADSRHAVPCRQGPRQRNAQKRVARERKKKQPRRTPAAPRAPRRQTNSDLPCRPLKCELCCSSWPSISKLRRRVSQVHRGREPTGGRRGPFASLLA